MFVYIIRHGESESNKTNMWTGWWDVKLTEKGREDALKAREYLKNVKFDKVFSSDLSRAYETATIVLPDYEIEKNEKLREFNVGSLSKNSHDITSKEEHEETARLGFAKYGGESKLDMKNRVAGFLHDIEPLDCENVAVFSHAGWLRGMMDLVTGIDQNRNTIHCKNCTISIYEYKNGMWKLWSWINPM